MGDAARRWRELQSGRGIPAEILARAQADPWRFPAADFSAPAEAPDTPSRRAALALLGAGGSVLDIGCGGGAAAFALVPPAHLVTGVDQQRDMVDRLRGHRRGPRRRAPDRAGPLARTGRGRRAGRRGGLPPRAAQRGGAAALPAGTGAAARRGVVVEMLAEHPMAWLDPLWVRFHGLHRPPSATVDDAVAVLRELGVAPVVTRWERTSRPRQDPDWVTRRLCLPADRTPEVAAALRGLVRPRTAATLTWRGSA